MPVRQRAQPLRQPGIVLRLPTQLRQGVIRMGIEPRRDQHQLRLKRLQPRKHLIVISRAHRRPIRPRRQRQVQHLPMRPAFRSRTRPRPQRHLLARHKPHPRLIPQQRLGAIAMMHVEIHHRNAGQPAYVQRVFRRNRHRPEQAKPHRQFGFGMMPRRPRQHKSPPPAHHRIHRRAGPANRP